MNFKVMPKAMSERLDEAERTPGTVEELTAAAAFFDGRDFEVGDVIMKRRDSKDSYNGGLCNYSNPNRGEPALVIAKIEPLNNEQGGVYNLESLIILTKYKNSNHIVRQVVDPVYFEKYVAPEPVAE